MSGAVTAATAADPDAGLDAQAQAAAAALAPEVPPPPDALPPDAPAAPQTSTADMLAPLLGAAFGIMAPAWSVQESEARALADAWGAVLDKYFPGGIALGVEINAVLLTLAVFGPRWNMPRKLPDKIPAPAPTDVPQS